MEENKIDNEVGAQVMDVDKEKTVQGKEVDVTVEYETVAGEDAKDDEKKKVDENAGGEGNKEDEKENEDVKVAEEEKREEEKVAEDLKLAGEGKRKVGNEKEDLMVAEEGEKKDIREVEDEKVEGDVKKEDENEEDDEKVAEDGKKDGKVAEEGKREDGDGEEDVKMGKGEKENEKDYVEGEMEKESKSVENKGDISKVTETDDMVEAKLDEMIETERKPDKPKVGKGAKRSRANSGAKKSDMDKKRKTEGKKGRALETPSEKEMIPKTPTPSLLDRPVRERKSVERLVAIIEKDSARDFRIEKGRGTALKDIPNVAYQLSKKKNADTFKLLHTIIFARREKAAQIKNNISRFSGFVWHDNKEKQMIKVKEKLDKCVKEKLIELCDVLDITVSRTRSRKEDIIGKLIDFLMEPHATALELLADKEQSSKGKKRKRGSGSAPGSNTPPFNGSSSKSWTKTKSSLRKGGEAESSQSESEEDKEEMDEDKDVNGIREISGDEVPEKAESEEKQCESEQESDEDKGKKKQVSEKPSAKKRDVAKAKTNEVTISNKARPRKKSLLKSPKTKPRKKDNKSEKKPSGKTKDVELTKKSTLKESASNESIGKKLLKVRDKYRENKSGPSDNELRNAISEILKEVDFNTATFTDILKLLAEQFDTDLTPRKSSVKSMIQDELTKLVDEDEGDADKDKKKSSTKGVGLN